MKESIVDNRGGLINISNITKRGVARLVLRPVEKIFYWLVGGEEKKRVWAGCNKKKTQTKKKKRQKMNNRNTKQDKY